MYKDTHKQLSTSIYIRVAIYTLELLVVKPEPIVVLEFTNSKVLSSYHSWVCRLFKNTIAFHVQKESS